VHFWTKHKDDTFTFHGKKMKGSALRDAVRAEMHTRLLAPAAPYNLEASNGVSATSASIAAASIGLQAGAWSQLSVEQKRDVQRAHLLLVMFNAMQPGVFALSGWDLVGAMTLPADSVKSLLADGDTRWINRGAYDLLGKNPSATKSSSDLPRAYSLYGPLTEQLATPSSFASQLKKILEVRAEHRIFESEQIELPQAVAEGLLVMVHRLPGNKGLEVTALNFGRKPVKESVAIAAATPGGSVKDLLAGQPAGRLAGKRLAIDLDQHQGKALLIE
jgi:trehalose synthase